MKTANKYDWSKNNILIAEDDIGNFTLLRYVLEDTKINVIRAINGIEAVNICNSNPNIDLILMDLKMPEMNGIEATKAIKSFLPDLPIIILSAHVIDEVKNNCFEAGCDKFISKPFDNEEMLEMINSLINPQ